MLQRSDFDDLSAEPIVRRPAAPLRVKFPAIFHWAAWLVTITLGPFRLGVIVEFVAGMAGATWFPFCPTPALKLLILPDPAAFRLLPQLDGDVVSQRLDQLDSRGPGVPAEGSLLTRALPIMPLYGS
jgi:hypothetical protein